MSRTREISDRQPLLKPGQGAGKHFEGNWRFWAAVIGLSLCFAPALYHLALFAADSDFYSYILLIPFVSLFLAWSRRRSISDGTTPERGMAAIFITAGGAVLAWYWLADRSAAKLTADDRLAFTTFSFLLLFFGICCLFLGRQTVRQMMFPMGMLVFMAPLPTSLMAAVEGFLQRGSAIVAQVLFGLAGTTFSREGLVFQLPGISIQVAPECSGIHSSMVLLIISLIAGYFFLRSPARRVTLALAVIPLALLRNGLRIFTIGQLCIHVGPEMIDSSFHHRWAGSLFFALSLIPFLALLYFLQNRERRQDQRSDATVPPGQIHKDSGTIGN